MWTAIKAGGEKKTSGDYTWTLKRNIDASGQTIPANGFALSGFIDLKTGDCIINTTGNVGTDDKSTAFFVHEYNSSGTWMRRTSIESNYIFVPGANCAKIRIGYGYPSAESTTITDELLAAYFSAIFCPGVRDKR